MKTTTIDMSKANGENVFTNVVWKQATQKEIADAMSVIENIKAQHRGPLPLNK